MYKERLITKILLPIFTVLLVFVIQIATFLGVSAVVVSNPKTAVSLMLNREVIDIACDETYSLFGKKIESAIDLSNVNKNADEVIEAVYSEEFIKFFLSETIESVLLGDRKYDKDYFEEWLNGINEELNGIGVSESEILKLDEKVTEALEDALKVTSTGSNKVWKAISTFLRGSVLGIVAVCFFISLGVMLVFMGILFLVARNKMLPVKYLGLAMIIANSLKLITDVASLIFLVVTTSKITLLEKLTVAMFKRVYAIDFSVYSILLIIGIILFVLGYRYTKAFKNKCNKPSLYDEVREYEKNKKTEAFEVGNDEKCTISE